MKEKSRKTVVMLQTDGQKETYSNESEKCHEGHQGEHESAVDDPLDIVLDANVGIQILITDWLLTLVFLIAASSPAPAHETHLDFDLLLLFIFELFKGFRLAFILTIVFFDRVCDSELLQLDLHRSILSLLLESGFNCGLSH